MQRFAILALTLVCGCAPMHWQRADASAEQRVADEQDCRNHAFREASIRSWHHHAMMGPVFGRDAMGGGFFVWPSGAVVDPYGHQIMEENRLAQFCMESKGYQLVPAPKR
jgi:hypothetical protein